MKKPVKIVLIAIPAVVVVLLLVVMFAVGDIVASAVPPVLSEVTGTEVELASVGVNPFTGKATITGFIIGNPKGYDTDSAFELREVRVDIGLMSLMSDTIVIDEIYINAPKITYEAGMTSNIGQIQKNIEEYAKSSGEEGKTPEPEEEEGEEEAGPGKKILIRRFVMEGGEVSVSIKGLAGKTVTVALPRIEETNIGGGEGEDDGKSIAEVSKEIFSSVGGKVTEAGNKGYADLKEKFGDAVKIAKEKFGDLGGEAKKLGKGAADAGKGVIEGIKGVFGGGDKD